MNNIQRALISVYDKTGIVPFAEALQSHDIELISTGGTREKLTDAGLAVRKVSDVTGFPEMMDGRVKSLHPAIHAGLLARRDNPEDMQELEAHGIKPIDLVVTNFYPFEAVIAERKNDASDDLLEYIDIGGPTMVRAAAKNHPDVGVVVDPGDYERIQKELQQENGTLSSTTRQQLARKAFQYTARYDQCIQKHLSEPEEVTSFPINLRPSYQKKRDLRYGENPHQQAALYQSTGDEKTGIPGAEQLHGKELSFNNIQDSSAALELVRAFDEPAVAVIKHTNPCGAAAGDDLLDTFQRAYSGDPMSAYGSIVALNRPVTADVAEAMAGPDKFFEVVITPEYSDKALEILKDRWNSVRLLEIADSSFTENPDHQNQQNPNQGSPTQQNPDPALNKQNPDQTTVFNRERSDSTSLDSSLGGDTSTSLDSSGETNQPRRKKNREIRDIPGGILLQDRDRKQVTRNELDIVTERQPSEETIEKLLFNWTVTKHVKSNAIVLSSDTHITGVGAGQMSRVDAMKIAIDKAGDRTQNGVAGSDAFFPFRDAIDRAAEAGISAIIQPGGSKRDDEVIEACNEHNIAMVFTGTRHFLH